MVPAEQLFCFTPNADGLVTSLVRWEWSDLESRITSTIYASSQDIAATLPVVDAQLGAKMYALQQQGRLLDESYLYDNMTNGYRIDDRRLGRSWTYMISFDEVMAGPRLISRTVYYCFNEGFRRTDLPLTDFDKIVALMHDPSVLLITRVDEWARKHLDQDPEVRQHWDLDNRVAVWDLAAIRHNRAPLAQKIFFNLLFLLKYIYTYPNDKK